MIYGGYFDPDDKLKRKQELEEIMLQADFWNDKNKSENVINELNNIKSVLDKCMSLKNKIDSSYELISSGDFDDDLNNLLLDDVSGISDSLSSLENLLVLNGPYDKGDAIIEIHPGAGGTESCDWANMLYRMYLRWCEKKGYKYEVIDYYYL